jgi:hypothetical protein
MLRSKLTLTESILSFDFAQEKRILMRVVEDSLKKVKRFEHEFWSRNKNESERQPTTR